LSSCCCLLLNRINILNHLYARINESKTLYHLQNHHGPLLRLKFRFLGFFKVALLSNFKNIVKCKLVIIGVQQMEDIFSISHTNLCTWLNVLGLGANQVSIQQCKSKQCEVGDYCTQRIICPITNLST
jgi:hypothetical protein